jgi:hypothetical protein
MSKIRRWIASLAVLALAPLGGCATHVPEMHNPGETQLAESEREANLAGYIKCELHRSVQVVLNQEDEATKSNPQRDKRWDAAWLRTWGVKASLRLVIDEKFGVSPGLNFNAPLRNVVSKFSTGGNVTSQQSQSTALGASISSDAMRTETTAFF